MKSTLNEFVVFSSISLIVTARKLFSTSNFRKQFPVQTNFSQPSRIIYISSRGKRRRISTIYSDGACIISVSWTPLIATAVIGHSNGCEIELTVTRKPLNYNIETASVMLFLLAARFRQYRWWWWRWRKRRSRIDWLLFICDSKIAFVNRWICLIWTNNWRNIFHANQKQFFSKTKPEQ